MHDGSWKFERLIYYGSAATQLRCLTNLAVEQRLNFTTVYYPEEILVPAGTFGDMLRSLQQGITDVESPRLDYPI